MKTSAVNISFQKDLLEAIDKVAKDEFRSRSELLREAARRYIGEKNRWRQIFAFCRRQARRLTLKESDISEAITDHRFRKRFPS